MSSSRASVPISLRLHAYSETQRGRAAIPWGSLGSSSPIPLGCGASPFSGAQGSVSLVLASLLWTFRAGKALFLPARDTKPSWV